MKGRKKEQWEVAACVIIMAMVAHNFVADNGGRTAVESAAWHWHTSAAVGTAVHIALRNPVSKSVEFTHSITPGQSWRKCWRIGEIKFRLLSNVYRDGLKGGPRVV